MCDISLLLIGLHMLSTSEYTVLKLISFGSHMYRDGGAGEATILDTDIQQHCGECVPRHRAAEGTVIFLKNILPQSLYVIHNKFLYVCLVIALMELSTCMHKF